VTWVSPMQSSTLGQVMNDLSQWLKVMCSFRAGPGIFRASSLVL